MDYENNRTVTAFYETRAAADAHLQQLTDLGVPASDIKIVDGADANEPGRQYEEKGFFESVSDFLLGDEDRSVYNEGLRRGGYLLTARVSAEHYDQALILLDNDHAVDMDARSDTWRAEGWDTAPAAGMAGTTDTGVHTNAMSAGQPQLDPALTDDKIEVVEESLRIGKRDVSHGRVRVRSYVVEDQISEDVALQSERVELERRPVDRAVEPGTAAFQDRTIEAEETAEEAVISKEARVVEEIDLKRRAETETETVRDTVRHTEVEVEDDRDLVQTDTPMPR